MNMPILRLELEGMKHSIAMAFTEYHMQVEQDVQEAIKNFCTPENLKGIINQEVQKAVTDCIQSAIKGYFSWGGEGRKAIAPIVEHHLSEFLSSMGGSE